MGQAGAPSARCRLYLAAPAALPANFAQTLNAVFAANDIACLRVAAEPASGPLIALAQAKGCAALLDGRPELVARLGADGVHLGDPAAYEPARRLLGPDFTIGVHCDSSRHLAMEAGEGGADYVAFAPDLDLVAWWAELMVVPVVAELGEDLGQAKDFIAAGADFICPGEALWRGQDPAGQLRRLALFMV